MKGNICFLCCVSWFNHAGGFEGLEFVFCLFLGDTMGHVDTVQEVWHQPTTRPEGPAVYIQVPVFFVIILYCTLPVLLIYLFVKL
jgi:hypothetical protein